MPQPPPSSSRRRLIAAGAVLVFGAAGYWWWSAAKADATGNSGVAPTGSAPRPAGPPVSVTTALVRQQDLPVTVIANGSVVALQAVDVRAQVASTVKTIHVAEGHAVRQGDLLFTLDARTEDANLKRAEAQVAKSRSDFANAERNVKRQRELFDQKFISQAALDTASTQMEVLKGQLGVDEAAVEASRVARTFTQIRAPFSGRTGAIAVRVGTLVQPNGGALVTISQIDPIGVAFAVPERELAYVQRAMAKGDLPVKVELPPPQKQTLTGTVVFIDSTIDAASGTIAMKAAFANPERALWPGMFVGVSLSSRVLTGAMVVPVQAVQSGPERKFVFVVGEGNKAAMRPVEVELTQAGLAAVKGLAAGTRIVVEGAQNVRNNTIVADGGAAKPAGAGKAGEGAAEKGALEKGALEKGAAGMIPSEKAPAAKP